MGLQCEALGVWLSIHPSIHATLYRLTGPVALSISDRPEHLLSPCGVRRQARCWGWRWSQSWSCLLSEQRRKPNTC